MNYLTNQLLIQEEIEALIKNLKNENTLWEDGKKTAGSHASKVKNNLQLNRETEISKNLSHLIKKKILSSPLIKSFALPKIIHGIMFTKSLKKVQNAKHLFAMGLPNRKAVADKIISLNTENLLILGSGWEGSYSLEDSLAAGALASYLKTNFNSEVNIANDELQAALALWYFWENDILQCLKTATHGKRLTSLGDYEDDFKCCSELDCLDIVPFQAERGVIRAS